MKKILSLRFIYPIAIVSFMFIAALSINRASITGCYDDPKSQSAPVNGAPTPGGAGANGACPSPVLSPWPWTDGQCLETSGGNNMPTQCSLKRVEEKYTSTIYTRSVEQSGTPPTYTCIAGTVTTGQTTPVEEVQSNPCPTPTPTPTPKPE
jgi:hypothetical protein